MEGIWDSELKNDQIAWMNEEYLTKKNMVKGYMQITGLIYLIMEAIKSYKNTNGSIEISGAVENGQNPTVSGDLSTQKEIENLREKIKEIEGRRGRVMYEIIIKEAALKEIYFRAIPFLKHSNKELEKKLAEYILYTNNKDKLMDILKKAKAKKDSQYIQMTSEIIEIENLKIEMEMLKISYDMLEEFLKKRDSELIDILSKTDSFLEYDIAMLEKERDNIKKVIQNSPFENRDALEDNFNGLIEKIKGRKDDPLYERIREGEKLTEDEEEKIYEYMETLDEKIDDEIDKDEEIVEKINEIIKAMKEETEAENQEILDG